MTIDEAIEHAEERACGNDRCAKDHAQLADWLRELRRARMEIDLLKTLRDGFKADAQKYKDENDKLRELIKDMWRDIPKSEACAWDSSANTCIGSDSCIGECSYWYRMVKLGIDADDE